MYATNTCYAKCQGFVWNSLSFYISTGNSKLKSSSERYALPDVVKWMYNQTKKAPSAPCRGPRLRVEDSARLAETVPVQAYPLKLLCKTQGRCKSVAVWQRGRDSQHVFTTHYVRCISLLMGRGTGARIQHLFL